MYEGVVIKLYDGSKLYLDPKYDKGLLLDLIEGKGYREKYSTLTAKKLIEKHEINQLFVDIGANIGYYTVSLGKYFKKIYSIEPVKDTFRRLRINIYLNSLERKTEMLNFALTSKPASTLKVSLPSSRSNNAFVSEQGSVVVESVSVKDFVDMVDVDKKVFTKIDVEGYEKDIVLEADMLSMLTPEILFLEFHNSRFTPEERERFLEYLTSYYRIRYVVLENPVLGPISEHIWRGLIINRYPLIVKDPHYLQLTELFNSLADCNSVCVSPRLFLVREDSNSVQR